MAHPKITWMHDGREWLVLANGEVIARDRDLEEAFRKANKILRRRRR